MAGLKLRAQDGEDIAVLSTVLQDALIAVADMVFLPEEKRFVLVANRFCWERPAGETPALPERVLSGFHVDGIRAVRRRGFHPREAERILVLLAIRAEEGALLLDFAGGGSIRLEVERILCHLEDIGEPWPSQSRPQHPVAET